MKMKIIHFESSLENYDKEQSGIKPNTVRFTDDWDNARWKKYTFAKYIEINNVYDESFIRKIKDKTEYRNLIIISW